MAVRLKVVVWHASVQVQVRMYYVNTHLKAKQGQQKATDTGIVMLMKRMPMGGLDTDHAPEDVLQHKRVQSLLLLPGQQILEKITYQHTSTLDEHDEHTPKNLYGNFFPSQPLV